MSPSPQREHPDQPIFDELPPRADALAQEKFAVVTFPGKHGHPESRELAKGAEYMGAAFRSMLRRAGIPFEPETVPCPKRSSKSMEAATDWFREKFTGLGWRKKDDTEQLRRFEQFKTEVDRSYAITLKHLLAGRKVLHAAASHDAIGRVLACKKAHPDAIILDFDKHPDYQVPGSGDNPGNADAVNGHAIWVAACTGVQNDVFAKLLPKDASLLEREDVLMAGILHPDPSESYGVAGIDPVTKVQTETPIPHVMGTHLEKPSDEEPLKAKIREWIDARKQRYGVQTIHIGIEDDPDSIRIDDIGGGITMPTARGMYALMKYNVLKWLHDQPDVEVVYYGTAEVRPDRDDGQKVRKQIELWASAAFGIGDVQYYHEGYGGGTEQDERILLQKRSPTGVLRHALTATAASILTLIGAEALREENNTKPNQNAVQLSRGDSQHISQFLKQFSKKSGFADDAALLQEAVEAGDAKLQDEVLDRLVDRYQEAEMNAHNDTLRWSLRELATSEFYRGFGTTEEPAGKEYLRFRKALQEKRNS